MRDHLDAEAAGRGWWAVLPDLGEDACAPGRRPGRRRWAFARALVRLLNFATDGGGAWSVAWVAGGRRLVLVWQDEDGAVQIVAAQSYRGHPAERPRSFLRPARAMLETWAAVTVAESHA